MKLSKAITFECIAIACLILLCITLPEVTFVKASTKVTNLLPLIYGMKIFKKLNDQLVRVGCLIFP